MDGTLSLTENGRLQLTPMFRSTDAKFAVTFAELIGPEPSVLIQQCRHPGCQDFPVADYAEGLCVQAFGWRPAAKSNKGHDAIDSKGRRFEIKGRRITAHNPSRQMGAIRGLPDRHFHALAAVLFSADFSVLRAALIPRLRGCTMNPLLLRRRSPKDPRAALPKPLARLWFAI
jgi:hypothetical protein